MRVRATDTVKPYEGIRRKTSHNASAMNKLALALSALAICTSLIVIPAVASETRFDFTLPIFGNANMDDIVDEMDIAYVQGILNNTNKATKLADANNDGKTDEKDIDQIEKIISGNEETLTIVDNANRTVTVKEPIKRIASFMPAERMAVRLNALDELVGLGTRTFRYADNLTFILAHPELRKLPDVGDMNDPNKEVMVSLNPDLILGWKSQAADLADPLQEATGVPVLLYDEDITNKFDGSGGAFQTWRLMGYVLDRRDRADELISYSQDELNKISEVLSKISESEKPKVYFAAGRGVKDITQAITKYEPIEIAGGVNVAKDAVPTNPKASSWVDISKEQIIDWNPDVILIHHFPGSGVKVETILADPLLQTVNAVKNKRVYNTMGAYMNYDPANGLAECFYLAKLFHPEAFKDIDVEEEGNEILKRNYGADDLFTWTLTNFGNYTKVE